MQGLQIDLIIDQAADLVRQILYGKGFESVSAKLMGNARLRAQRGGVRGWTEVKTEIVRHLRTDERAIRDHDGRLLRHAERSPRRRKPGRAATNPDTWNTPRRLPWWNQLSAQKFKSSLETLDASSRLS